MGPAALSPMHLQAWQQLYDIRFNPWELDLLMTLDRVAIKAMEAPAEQADQG